MGIPNFAFNMATRIKREAKAATNCYHCGELCLPTEISWQEKTFCCQGCRMVYEILEESNLCQYYQLNEKPGIHLHEPVRLGKFDFLDDVKIQQRLVRYADEQQTHVCFHIPQMHCSSCLYLLENLHKLSDGILSSKVFFDRKEATISFKHANISLPQVAELLSRIGYEPAISLEDLETKKNDTPKLLIYQIGVAGFCFSNIMLMSFPEYLGIDSSELTIRSLFRWFNLVLALPVLLFSALPFFISSWKSLHYKYLHIDAPIALAILITFIRSAYEVISETGGGYFDSMSGIVFFMLAGRFLQDKSYQRLSFDRDYKSYFPIAISVVSAKGIIPTALPDIRLGDTLCIHSNELIPTDGILTKGRAYIDYSFVTGESEPVWKEVGEMVYAGGRQKAGKIETLVIKEVAQSYLTQLWNEDKMGQETEMQMQTIVNKVSHYFTLVLLLNLFT